MRAVVDTNVLVSGLLHRESVPARLLQAMTDGLLVPVVCHEVMAEYRAVLPRPRLRLQADDIDELLALIGATAEWVTIPPYDGMPSLPDVADWPFIACALAAGCPVVTGNARHFPARSGIEAMTARAWLQRAGIEHDTM